MLHTEALKYFSTTNAAISGESDESRMNFIPITVRQMYVELYLCFIGKDVYLLKWVGNLVCSPSKIIKMMTL